MRVTVLVFFFLTVFLFQNCSPVESDKSAGKVAGTDGSADTGSPAENGPSGENNNNDSPDNSGNEKVCIRSSATPKAGVVGLSDPNLTEPVVQSLVKDSGARWVRMEFHWSIIEQTPGQQYNWEVYDDAVAYYVANGIRISAIVSYIPWSLLDNPDWPDIYSRYDVFVRALFERYSNRITYWEIFNEPNLTGYGWLKETSAVKKHLKNYAEFLKISNYALRDINPESFIILGGLASDQHRGLPIEETMQELYGEGIKDCFDIFAFHPYGYQAQFPVARKRVDDLLEVHGDNEKPVWFNEYGWTNFVEMDFAVNQTVDNNPMIRAFSQAGSADAFFWFSAKDFSSRADQPTFGLADYKGNKRGSFTTFREIMKVINGQ